ncbi:MAG: hypothetical protein IPK82_22310 [Polyangiaceae bacterium]|nr:hypothetical protein [Polyangiaceae bacterium]
MRLLALAFAAAFALVACDDGSTGTGGSGGGTTSTGSAGDGGTGAATASTGGGGTGGDTGGSTTSSSSTSSGTGGMAPVGSCGRKCEADADCCPAGTPGCPGPYPANYACVEVGGEKICQFPKCASNADCESTGLAGYQCLTLAGGSVACLEPCAVDGDCSSPTKCIGTSENGTKFCTIEMTPFMCTPGDGQCAGYGECAVGGDKCVCQNDDDCADGNYLKDCVGVGK